MSRRDEPSAARLHGFARVVPWLRRWVAPRPVVWIETNEPA